VVGGVEDFDEKKEDFPPLADIILQLGDTTLASANMASCSSE
jgi:hypothetical protein